MNENILLLLAGVAAVLMLGKKNASTGSANAPWVPPQAIPVAVPNGWQYFTDGTAISPEGVYYHKGVQVWAP
ncbi:hypothetical protein [Pseudoduganella armeniaca]|uniref:Uncharacterized protein n=1 Tax=Pseudoduganella armeniaca TaxID=2072590 RepID=A0A2R4CBB7_9BURK|nr:hypothetical protein [Pseudoduganella armeniaca]AVR96891.1 hypothetical protein C9I28_15370 [Pseudoduganella armeniaca]